jgi:hypothetical protein
MQSVATEEKAPAEVGERKIQSFVKSPPGFATDESTHTGYRSWGSGIGMLGTEVHTDQTLQPGFVPRYIPGKRYSEKKIPGYIPRYRTSNPQIPDYIPEY